jgi:hypothetical protein
MFMWLVSAAAVSCNTTHYSAMLWLVLPWCCFPSVGGGAWNHALYFKVRLHY